MTFDQFANQGGPASWDPEAAAAAKKAGDRLFAEADDSIDVDDVVVSAAENADRGVGTDGDEDTPKPDSE